MTRVQTRHYVDGALRAVDFPLADVSEYLAQPSGLVWVDLLTPTHADLAMLADELGLHELAVEDALSAHQRPKLDRYESHLFISMHAVTVASDGTLEEIEIDAFLNSRWLVTVRKGEAFSMEPVIRRWERSPDLARQGVSFFLYGLLDVVVDGYFETLEAFDIYYDDVSEAVFTEQALDPAAQRRWFEMRRSLVRFHRLVVPMRETVSALMRREHATVTEATYPYYQDVCDHILRVTESTEALRDLVSTIVEANLSLREYRQNQIMKKVTSWAAIVAVPTLITGWYGMNVPYPGADQHTGMLTAAGLIVITSTALYATFRRRDWL